MPHVIGSSTKIIFCEGRPGSLDSLVLNQLITKEQILIQPVGGKHAMRAFIEGYLSNYPGISPSYLGFRDRDFDFEPSEQPELIRIPGEKPIWLSHRASIESYLIDAELLWQYWEEHAASPGWKHGRVPTKDEIKDHIRSSALSIRDYQAVRWGLAKLKPGLRWPEIQTTWTRNGDIPQKLDFDSCLEQAHQLVLSFQQAIEGINLAFLKKHSDDFFERFKDNGFVANHDYLIWFHGKDLLAQLCHQLTPNFPRRHYAEWGAEHLDASRFYDLQQLVSLATAE